MTIVAVKRPEEEFRDSFLDLLGLSMTIFLFNICYTLYVAKRAGTEMGKSYARKIHVSLLAFVLLILIDVYDIHGVEVKSRATVLLRVALFY